MAIYNITNILRKRNLKNMPKNQLCSLWITSLDTK